VDGMWSLLCFDFSGIVISQRFTLRELLGHARHHTLLPTNFRDGRFYALYSVETSGLGDIKVLAYIHPLQSRTRNEKTREFELLKILCPGKCVSSKEKSGSLIIICKPNLFEYSHTLCSLGIRSPFFQYWFDKFPKGSEAARQYFNDFPTPGQQLPCTASISEFKLKR
jgi:hypothetical protein